MIRDALDLPLSCASPAAALAYGLALDRQLHAWNGMLEAVAEALALDPEFALAHAAQALMLQARGRAGEARAALALARQCAVHGTPRELAHVALIGHLVEGRPAAALEAVAAHAREWPTDVLAMSTALGAFGLYAFSGRLDHDSARLDFVRQLAPHYPADHAWMLTQQAWAHIEAGALDVGDACIARSLQLRPANGNAAHVQMHALFERGRPEAGIAFVDGWIGGYPRDAMLFGHVHWHAVLCEIELGRPEAAGARLLETVVAQLDGALPLIGLTDVASALWRLALVGRTDLPWALAAAVARRHFAAGGNAFAELHLAMIAAAQADPAALAACAERLQRQADAGHAGAPVALGWVRGLSAWLGGDADRARAEIAACRPQAPRLGGSHAQRMVIDRTLADLPPAPSQGIKPPSAPAAAASPGASSRGHRRPQWPAR